MIEEVEKTGDAAAYVKQALDRGDRLMGFGHRVYRAEDPRARVLRRTAKELGAPRYEVAAALEKAALDELHARRPDRVLATNVEFWAAIMLDFAEVPAHMFTSMFTCARTAGWAAHILEQKRTGRLVRPSARYVGPKLAIGPGRAGRRRRSSTTMSEPANIVIPAELLPADGRFGCGPTKVQAEQVAALAAAGRRPARHLAPAGTGAGGGAAGARRPGPLFAPAR